MPLAARLPCWGDLGRYEARNFSLPTLREYEMAIILYGLYHGLFDAAIHELMSVCE